MGRIWIIVYLLVACAHLSYQKSTPNSTTYVAAVVEYSGKQSTNASETLRINTNAYVKYIHTAGSFQNADIIVFPEDGLTTLNLPVREKLEEWTTIIPNASQHYIPCIQNNIEVSEALRKISCAARDNKIYVVINIAEKVPCNNGSCSRDKMLYYNSNVVFDRTGKIIARYRKTNLFAGELYQFNVTAMPEVITFDTDFGVKFGTFICFDILFREPAITLTRDRQITDIVYPTAWFSDLPFFTAVQMQAGWSFAEDVNLLVAGFNQPKRGSTGSGIYLGRKGIGTAIMSRTIDEKLLIYQVPKIKDRHNKNYHSENQNQKIWPYYHDKEHDELYIKNQEDNTMMVNDELFLTHDDMRDYQTLSLKGNTKETMCHNGFCCEFKVEIVKVDPRTKYRLAAFNGERWYLYNSKGKDIKICYHIRTCAVIQCLNDSISSCASAQKSETIFSNIEITATFNDYKNNLIMPSTLGLDLLPLKNWIFNEHIHNDHVHINMVLDNNTNNLVTFGIFSKDFKKSNANIASFCIINYFIMLLVTLFSRL